MNFDVVPKYLLETDILIEFLTCNHPVRETSLIKLMQKGICFTSVLNASELFMLVKSDFQKEKVRDLLNALKVLGIPARYSLSISNYTIKFNKLRDALFYILAEQNRLTIVSFNPERYSQLKVNVINPHLLS